MYKPQNISASDFVSLRNHNYHVRVWGDLHQTYHSKPLVMLHGWMDVSASFQFLVDALEGKRLIIAPDWRGFGLTTASLESAPKDSPREHQREGSVNDHYVFADYLGDLDFLLDHYFPRQSVDLLGHSMGGNIAMLYAGIRPQRIHKLINLEGFGMPSTRPSQAPSRYEKWIDELKQFHKGEITLQTYESSDAVAKRLIKTNPRIPNDKAQWLATQWARPDTAGKWNILANPSHKISSANLYRVDETLEIHKRITAPLLCITGQDDSLKKWFGVHYTMEEFHERLLVVPNTTHQQLANSGHMLHHDQPQALAELIEPFLN